MDGNDVSSSVLKKIHSIQSIVSPLNSIGMPHYNNALLSLDLPPPSEYPSNPPQKIPTQILNTLKLDANGLGSAALPPELKGKRNVKQEDGQSGSRARFRSAKSKEVSTQSIILS